MEGVSPSKIPENKSFFENILSQNEIPNNITSTSSTIVEKNVEKASEQGHSILKTAGKVAKAIGKGGAIVAGFVIYGLANCINLVVAIPLGAVSLVLRGALFFVPFVPGKEVTNFVTGFIRYPLIGLFTVGASLMKLGGFPGRETCDYLMAAGKAAANATRWNTKDGFQELR